MRSLESHAVDPRLLFLAELLLAPVGIAVVLLVVLGVIHFVLPLRKHGHSAQPPSSV